MVSRSGIGKQVSKGKTKKRNKNPVAKDLRTPKYKMRTIPDKKKKAVRNTTRKNKGRK
jgi:hypothetical protein